MLRTAEALADRSIDRIVSSSLTRCRQSGLILQDRLGVEMEINPELSEINLGDWEGLTATEVKERYAGQYTERGNDLAHFRPKNGESFNDLLGRVLPAFETLRSSTDGTLAVVAHAGVNRVILCHVLGVPLANLFRIEQHYGCINILNYDDSCIRINCLNYYPAS